MGGTGEGGQEQKEESSSNTENQQSQGAMDSIKNLMDLKECIQDSPHFRLQLRKREQEINDLETKLERVVHTCDKMVATGNSYTEACRSFSVSIKELSTHFNNAEVVTVSLRKFYEALSELQSYYSILFDQAQRSVQSSLKAYLSGELRKVKETKKTFHRVSDDFRGAINRSGHAPRSKPQEADEASAYLLTMQNQFSHNAIDYGFQINTINCSKGYEILHNLLAFMRAQFTFFHQGYDLLREFDPFMKQVAGQVDILRKESSVIVKKMQTRHSLVSPQHLQDGSPDEPLSPMENPSVPIETSGYLFKRPRGNNPFKSWSRRWFILMTNKLVYQSESKEQEHVTVAEDLRICTVKLAEDQERRFCFEVVTPTRSCMLQADSEVLRKKWLNYLEAGIARALRISASNKKKEDMDDFRRRSVAVSKGPPIHFLSHSPTSARHADTAQSNYSLGIDFLEVPGNDKCADCCSPKPTWASINLGIMLCIECSGIHRGLGVHISKVRSVTLDDWEPELQKIMCALGNSRVNAIYEYEIPPQIKKPTSASQRSARETYIRLKYIQHAFVHPHPDFTRPDIPVPPLSIPELLAPSKHSLSALIASPKSPQKRSFSPSLKIRSPKVPKGIFSSRPSSATSSMTDQSSLAGSEEDIRKPELSQSYDPPSGLQLLAENFKKLNEREKERKSGRGSWSIGDRFKSAKRSSKRISNYALTKLGEGQESLMRRLKRNKDKAVVRETLSDTEEDTLGTQSTPLLISMSASTQNLSSSAEVSPKISRPPPKPPRTWKTNLKDLVNECPVQNDSEEEGECKEGDFSADVLLAIKQVGVAYSALNGSTPDAVANGHIPTPLMRSESSPQLSRSDTAIQNGNGSSNSSEAPSLRLQTISEDNADSAHPERPSSVNEESSGSNLQPAVDDRLVKSVPLQRKTLPASSVKESIAPLDSQTSDTSIPIPPKQDPASSESPENALSKRFSILSTTSAEFYSAESSSDSCSKPNSTSPSPQLVKRRPVPSLEYEMEDEDNRNCSSLSVEDENFNTPPSSPYPSTTSSPNVIAGTATLKASDYNSIYDRATPESGLVTPESDCVASESNHVTGEDSHVTPDGNENDHPMPIINDVAAEKNHVTPASDHVTTEDSHVTDKLETTIENGVDGDDIDGSVTISIIEASELESKEPDSGNQESESTTTTYNDEKEDEVTTPTQKIVVRTRSLTVTSSDTLREKYQRKTTTNTSFTSKDDNFETEYKEETPRLSASDGLMSYFSQQDLEDIFGSSTESGFCRRPIETVSESREEEEEEEEEANAEEEEVGEEEMKMEVKEEGEGEEFEMISPTSSLNSPVEAVVIPDTLTPDLFLYNSVSGVNIPGILCALAHGGNINFAHAEDSSKTPIIHAVEMGNTVLLEYLYQNGGKLSVTDALGRGCLHMAATQEDPNLVMMLLKKGADPSLKDTEGKDPIAYALKRENGDIVTMLRMATFRAKTQNSSDDRQSQYQELESEFFRDLEVASLVDSDRISKRVSTASLEGSSSTASRDSKETQN